MAEEIKLKFTADTAEAISGINRIKSSLAGVKNDTMKFGSDLKTAFGQLKSIAGGVAAVMATATAAAAGLAKGLKDVASYAGQLQDISDSTGMSIKNTSIMVERFRRAGVDASKVEGILGRLSNKLYQPSKETLSTLSKLGVSINDLKGLDAGKQLDIIGKKIMAINDLSTKKGIISSLIGLKATPGVLRFFDPQGIKTAEKFLGDLPAVMDVINPTMDKAGEAFEGYKEKYLQFFAGISYELLGQIEQGTEEFEGLNLLPAGQQVGVWIRQLIQDIQTGDIWGHIIPGLVDGLYKLSSEFITFIAFITYSGIQEAVNRMMNSKIFAPILGMLGVDTRALKYVASTPNAKDFFTRGVISEAIENPKYRPNIQNILGRKIGYWEFRKESQRLQEEYKVPITLATMMGPGLLRSAGGVARGLHAGTAQTIRNVATARASSAARVAALEEAAAVKLSTIKHGNELIATVHRQIRLPKALEAESKLLRAEFGGVLAAGATGTMKTIAPIAKIVATRVGQYQVGKFLIQALGGGHFGLGGTKSIPSALGQDLARDYNKPFGPSTDLGALAMMGIKPFSGIPAPFISNEEYAARRQREQEEGLQKLFREHVIPGYDEDAARRGILTDVLDANGNLRYRQNLAPSGISIGDSIGESLGKSTVAGRELKKAFIPALTSLGQRGGAAAEVGAHGVLDLQRQSVKHLSLLEQYTARIWKFIEKGEHIEPVLTRFL